MAVKNKAKMPYEKKKSFAGFLFVLPWFVGFIYFFLIPFINSFNYSLSDVKFTDSSMSTNFIGFGNYVNAFTTDPDFLKRLTYTLQNMLYQCPLVLVFSLFLAIMLNHKFRGRLIVRGIFFLPVIIASGVIINILKNGPVAQAMMSGSKASVLFQGIQFGELLLDIGVPNQAASLIMQVINGIFELVWKSGVQTLLFLSALQSIPTPIYESAQIEGATGWEIFWKITVPIMSPMLMLNAFYTIMDTSTDYSNMVVRYIRDVAAKMNLSYSSALSSIWFLIIMLIVGVLFFIAKNRVYVMDDRG